MLVHDRTVGQPVQLNAQGPGQFIFRNQTNRQEQGITLDVKLRAGNRLHLIVNFGYRHTGHTVFTVNPGNGMGQIQRDIIII